MKTAQKKKSAFQPKTVFLALSTLFLAGSLSAQPAPPAAATQNNKVDTPCSQSVPPCVQNGHGYQHGYGIHHRQWRQADHMRLTESLQLTENQQTQLQGIAQKLQEQRRELAQQIAEVQVQLNGALYQPQLDKTAIAALQEQQGKLGQEMMKLNQQARVQALEVLTAEQRQTLGQQAAQRPNQRMRPDRRAMPPCMQATQE